MVGKAGEKAGVGGVHKSEKAGAGGGAKFVKVGVKKKSEKVGGGGALYIKLNIVQKHPFLLKLAYLAMLFSVSPGQLQNNRH